MLACAISLSLGCWWRAGSVYGRARGGVPLLFDVVFVVACRCCLTSCSWWRAGAGLWRVRGGVQGVLYSVLEVACPAWITLRMKPPAATHLAYGFRW